jgi:hypothetical protein
VKLSARTGAAANEQTNKQTNEQTNKQTNKQTNEQTNKQTNKQTHERAARGTGWLHCEGTVARRSPAAPAVRTAVQPRLARKANRPPARWRTSRLHSSGRAAWSVRSRRRCGSGVRPPSERLRASSWWRPRRGARARSGPGTPCVILHSWRRRHARARAELLRRLAGFKPGRGRCEA